MYCNTMENSTNHTSNKIDFKEWSNIYEKCKGSGKKSDESRMKLKNFV